MKTILNTFLLFFKINIFKILVIFFVGFVSRFVVNYYSDINVFADFTSIISIIYYLNMSCIIVYINNMDLQFNGLKNSLAGITYDHIINVIKFMIDSPNISKATMNWEGHSLNDYENVNKKGIVMFMNDPQGGDHQGINDQGGIQQYEQGGSPVRREYYEPEYRGRSRYVGLEPMDIPELSYEDRTRLCLYLSKVRDGEVCYTGKVWSGTPKMSHVLDNIEKVSGPEASYGISKQVAKYMWRSRGRFDDYISSNGRVSWSQIGVGPDSKLMCLLRRGYSGGSDQ